MEGDMTDDLRARMRIAMKLRDASARHSNSEKPVLGCYDLDSIDECGVRGASGPNTGFVNEIKSLTPLHRFSANIDSHTERAAAGPEGEVRCQVEIVELPQAQRYRKVFAFLQVKAPAHIEENRWRQAVRDGSSFLAVWGDQAQGLGWTSADLFGLHTPPANPHPTYSRLSRYDETGLIWLLQGRPVVALTEATAAILSSTGAVTTYRRHSKPGLGPLGDSLEDLV
jgi:hypothetical protein